MYEDAKFLLYGCPVLKIAPRDLVLSLLQTKKQNELNWQIHDVIENVSLIIHSQCPDHERYLFTNLIDKKTTNVPPRVF